MIFSDTSFQCENSNEFYATYRTTEHGMPNNHLDPADKKEWCDALRSGKYKQVRGRLHNGEAYCCLGVKCDLAGLPREDMGDNYWQFIYNKDSRHSSILPRAYANKIGMVPDGNFTYSFTYENVTYYNRASLTELNDHGFDFFQIADVIEYFF